MPPDTAPSSTSCIPKSKRPKTLALPVLSAQNGHGGLNAWSKNHPIIQHSRVGKWRAAVLIFVHLVIAAHIAQWLITGLTLSPVEPSESMYTLRDGTVNAGFVFFSLALLSTLLFGRFFCGWACHIVAVQDLCYWVMMKVGVKPRPFRSRLLLWVPLGLALYMFVWPVVVRDVLHPLLADARGRLPEWLGQVQPLPGVRTAFLVNDFWATFAAWYVAIPFVLAVGVFTVYFLGAKAFCTYGCPYGGFFAPVDRFAVGRIVVNDDCEQCGHCTAVCTSNVRVHEEVRDFGKVMDPGCMKCLDCVSVCPNDALSFGFAAPAVFTKVRPGAESTAKAAAGNREARWDLSWVEEIVVGVLWLVLFMCFRGMLNQVPMLMAVAMAGLGAWAVWRAWRLLRDDNSRVHGFILKQRGKLRPWGVAFALATACWLAIAGWSGYIRWQLYQAELAYQTLDAPPEVVLRPDFVPTASDASHARAALEHYRKASPPGTGIGRGGLGFFWPLRPDELVNISYLHLLLGERDQAERVLSRLIEVGRPKDELVFQLAQMMHAGGQSARERAIARGTPEVDAIRATEDVNKRIDAMLTDALARHDELFAVRSQVLQQRAAKDRAGALEEWTRAVQRHPRSIDGMLAAAQFQAGAGETKAAIDLVERCLAEPTIKPEQQLAAAGLLVSLGQAVRAKQVARQSAEASLRLPAPRALVADFFGRQGDMESAAKYADQAVTLAHARKNVPGRVSALFDAGKIFLSLRQPEKGLALVREAADDPSSSAWDVAKMGVVIVQAGIALQGSEQQAGVDLHSADVIKEGVRILERARAMNPDATVIRRDLADAYMATGRTQDALKEMFAAMALGSANLALTVHFADMLEHAGQADAAAKMRQRAREIAGRAPGAATPKP